MRPRCRRSPSSSRARRPVGWAIAVGWARPPRGCTLRRNGPVGRARGRERRPVDRLCGVVGAHPETAEGEAALPASRAAGGRTASRRRTRRMAVGVHDVNGMPVTWPSSWSRGGAGVRGHPPPFVVENPQIRYRGFFETEDHPVTGSPPTSGLPFSMSGIASWFVRLRRCSVSTMTTSSAGSAWMHDRARTVAPTQGHRRGARRGVAGPIDDRGSRDEPTGVGVSSAAGSRPK